jgi:hypothetical protein
VTGGEAHEVKGYDALMELHDAHPEKLLGGLTAETVVVGLEDVADYRAFEDEIVADYDPQSVIEHDLVCRLASLLWRLRRANLIETGLLRIESERAQGRSGKSAITWTLPTTAYGADRQAVLTRRFLRLADLSGKPLERISRYEGRLWRQFMQALYALDKASNNRIARSRGRFTPYPSQW